MNTTAYVSISRANDRIENGRWDHVVDRVGDTLRHAQDDNGSPAVRVGPCRTDPVSPDQTAIWLIAVDVDTEMIGLQTDLAAAARDLSDITIIWSDTTPRQIPAAPQAPPGPAQPAPAVAPAPVNP